MKIILAIALLLICSQANFRGDPQPSPYYPKFQFAGDLLFISGANGADETGAIPGDVYDQTIQTLTVLEHRLQEAKVTRDQVVKVRGWLGLDCDFADFNRAYSTFFPANNTNNPARSIALADFLTGNNSRVELEYVVYVGKDTITRGPLASPYYSSYVKGGDWVFVAGTNAQNPQGAIVGDITNQTAYALTQIGKILNSAGCSYKDVVKVQAVIGQDAEIDEFNSIYPLFFSLNDSQHLPSRSLQVGVAHSFQGSRIELDAIAYMCGAPEDQRKVKSVGYIAGHMDPPVKIVGGIYSFVSGHVAENSTGQITGKILNQTKLTLGNIQSDLADAGFNMLTDSVFLHGWLASDSDFVDYNAAYGTYFQKLNPQNPARSMSLGVPDNGQNARVEIEIVGYNGPRRHFHDGKFLADE